LNSSPFIRDVQASGGQDGTVFIAGINENGGAFNNRTHIMYRSTNGGVSWTNTTMVSNVPAPGNSLCTSYFVQVSPIWRYMGIGQPGVGPGGVVHYTYTAWGGGTDEGDIFYVRSTDNGTTWGTPVRID